MKFISLFAGIGGLDLGFERAGLTCVAQVEIDPFCQMVLEKHWPDVPRYGDISTVRGDRLPHCDVLAGGFPCQDLSYAGFGAGIEGARSGLWGEYARLIREIRPEYVVVENVAALLARGAGRVLGDLASYGYDAEWRIIPASSLGLPHERERLFIVAYANEKHGETGMGDKQNRTRTVFTPDHPKCVSVRLQAADQFIGVDDGISAQSYLNRAGAIGNAIAVPVAEYVGRCVMEHATTA